MGKIVAEADAERVEEALDQRRRQIWSRVRSAVSLLVLSAVLFLTYFYRAELQLLLTKPAAQNNKAAASASLKAAQDSAATRDTVVDEIAK